MISIWRKRSYPIKTELCGRQGDLPANSSEKRIADNSLGVWRPCLWCCHYDTLIPFRDNSPCRNFKPTYGARSHRHHCSDSNADVSSTLYDTKARILNLEVRIATIIPKRASGHALLLLTWLKDRHRHRCPTFRWASRFQYRCDSSSWHRHWYLASYIIVP